MVDEGGDGGAAGEVDLLGEIHGRVFAVPVTVRVKVLVGVGEGVTNSGSSGKGWLDSTSTRWFAMSKVRS